MSKVASSSRQSMKTAEYDDESSSELMSGSLGVGLAKKQTRSTTDASRNVKAMYDKIESIKSTISMANAERAELWIQRQNLQDLYHQIILGDIDFVIDKKLEQDLWNYVFKTEINYFQSQIREQSHANSQAAQSSSSSNATSSSIQQQQHAKKFECQANLALFLEAARGFYTRLLEDVLIKYHMTELSQLLNASATIAKKSRHSAVDSDTEKHLKQINYICQHILTHLGDIARYQSLYEEAKQYYSHAIRLVPYLGHPYNQLGILLETTRTNQLATVFYYMRSISVRYAFPLASTNLENFFNKLIEVPLSRFMPSITTSANEVKSVPIKLPHMDLIALFLQINAMLYFSVKKPTSVNENKLSQLFELFKTSFVSFIETPVQKERLDALQFTQMIAIVIFHFASNTPHRIALELLLFLLEQLVYLASSRSDDLILTPLYIALSFLGHLNTPSTLIADNKLWESSANVEKYVRALVKCLNEFDASPGESSDDDVPISDDRMLECYLPMREWHKKLDFKKSTINSQDEKKLRKRRIVEIFERALGDESSENEEVKESKCYIHLVSKKTDTDRFSVSRHCPISSPIRNEKEITEEKHASSNSPSSATGSIRKRRQNVAIASITGEVSESAAAEVVEGSKSTTATKSTPPQNRLANQQQQQRTTSNILPQWQPQSKPQPSNSQQKPSFFPSALTSNRQLITAANSQAAYPRPTLHPPGQEQFRSVNSSNNGFPSFLPTTNHDSAAFRADLGTKFPNTNANTTAGNLFRVVPNQQIEWLLQQQQQQQSNLQKSSGNMTLLNAFSSNQATFDHLRSSNQGSSSIWSPGAFPSASSNKNTPQMHGIDLNPSMESWQKGLNLPPPTATNEYDMGNRGVAPLGLGQQQQQQKDAQKSFEFNLNMMNMMNMLNNTLVLPSNDPNSSIWVNSNSNNEQK